MPCNCRMSASKVPAVCQLRPDTGTLLAALLVSCLLSAIPAAAQQHPLDAAAGKALFERHWVAAPASTAAADGLGPLYNARSCAECHPGGGSSDALEHLVLRLAHPLYGRQLQTRALAGLQPEGRLNLSWSAVDGPVGMGQSLTEPMGPEPMGQSLYRLRVSVKQLHSGELREPWSLRMPPSLHGVGGIAAVSDSSLLALADPLDSDGDGISGRVAWVIHDGAEQIGRFGWKAESADLARQVASAFSLDLGLGSAAFPSPHGDCTALQHDCLRGVDGASTGGNPGDHELPPLVIDLVTHYLQTLRPAKQPPQHEEGLALFKALGCAACHTPQVEGQWLFSDLLLHDMGPALADALPQVQAAPGEWRTAPLSALAGKTRFLHDGRARSLREALLWHGGEAQQARSGWLAAPPEAQDRLESFLKQLQMR